MSMTWDTTNTPVKTAAWPDLSKDQKAIELANEQLGTGANVHDVLALAQKIKQTLA